MLCNFPCSLQIDNILLLMIKVAEPLHFIERLLDCCEEDRFQYSIWEYSLKPGPLIHGIKLFSQIAHGCDADPDNNSYMLSPLSQPCRTTK